MRTSWVGVLGVGVAVLIAGGCKSTDPNLGSRILAAIGWKKPQPNLKPLPHPEDYSLPPEDDARFSQPIDYPKEVLDADLMKKSTKGKGNAFGPGGPSPSRIGMGPGPGNF